MLIVFGRLGASRNIWAVFSVSERINGRVSAYSLYRNSTRMYVMMYLEFFSVNWVVSFTFWQYFLSSQRKCGKGCQYSNFIVTRRILAFIYVHIRKGVPVELKHRGYWNQFVIPAHLFDCRSSLHRDTYPQIFFLLYNKHHIVYISSFNIPESVTSYLLQCRGISAKGP